MILFYNEGNVPFWRPTSFQMAIAEERRKNMSSKLTVFIREVSITNENT